MNQKQRTIKPKGRATLADDPGVDHALWVLANVLLEIARKEVGLDGADMPRMQQQGTGEANKESN